MGNTASRKTGAPGSPQSSTNPTHQHHFQPFPASPVALPVYIPSQKAASASQQRLDRRRSESVNSPDQHHVSAPVPVSGSRASGPTRYIPSAPVPLPSSSASGSGSGSASASRRPPVGSHDPRSAADSARTIPINVPGRGGTQSGPQSVQSQKRQQSVNGQAGYTHSHNPAGLDSDDVLSSYRNEYRPPRLPLAIGDGGTGPTDTDISHPMPGLESGASIVHAQISGDHLDPLSPAVIETSSDEEDGSDDRPKQEGLVPTLIEWTSGGSRVYVTGTFANWNRKYRLHKSGPSTRENAMSTVLNLKPGTHHLKFIVDNDLRLSSEIPTTVDFTNILVNYIDVEGPDQAGGQSETGQILDDQSRPSADPQTPFDGRKHLKQKKKRWDHVRVPVPPSLADQVSDPLNILPPGTVIRPDPPENATQPTQLRTDVDVQYHSKIPAFLLHMEEDASTVRATRSAEVINRLYVPPTLPMFLAKSILNTATPLKDDASVLVIPNHTVLNHLATSSIKQNVLATSVTTRYRRKFLTTIMHKPVGENAAS